MYNLEQAHKVVLQNMPDGKIQATAEYMDQYLFVVFTDDPDEGMMDPFYSVDMRTGEFKEFPFLTHADPDEIIDLLTQGRNDDELK